MPFAGMVGRMLAKTMLQQRTVANAAKGAVNAAGGYRGAFSSSGKYLFVAHPECCEKCRKMNGTIWNTPDVAFISHPNCMCATIEAPGGMSPAELMEWTKAPVGVMRFGFNYGQSLKPVQLRHDNRDNVFAQWKERMSPEGRSAHPRRFVRQRVSQDVIDRMRARVESGELAQGKNLTGRIQGFVNAAATRKSRANERQRLESTLFKRNDVKNAFTQRKHNTTEIPRNNRGNTMVKLRNIKLSKDLRAAARALGGSRELARKNFLRRRKGV